MVSIEQVKNLNKNEMYNNLNTKINVLINMTINQKCFINIGLVKNALYLKKVIEN